MELNKAVQQCEIDILQRVDEICQRHGLCYFAIGGTALGAVRHKGFIPWDDDIDVGMPREDYTRFLEAAKEELPAGYHLQHFSTEPKTPFYFAKIRRDGTKFVEYYLRDADIHQGVFVDIFPFDHVPEKEIVKKLHFRLCRGLYQLFLCKSLTTVCSSRFERKENRKSAVRKLVHYALFWLPKSWLYHALDKSCQMFNKQETQELSHIVRRRLRVYLKDLYPISYLPFDGIEMPVPCNYDAYLKAQFGDYDALPPEEKRYGHLPYEVQLQPEENDK